MHLNSELIFRKYLLPRFHDNLKVLEIGPSGIPSIYQKIVNNPKIEWHTIDLKSTTYIGASPDNLTYLLSSPYCYPIKDQSYDIIISGQVIEHVEKPWIWLKELKRITKTNGFIFTISPLSWPYHEAPVDCWRIYPSGMKALAKETDLNIELCLMESLEKEQLLRRDPSLTFIPGQSYDFKMNDKMLSFIINWNKIIRHIPFLIRNLIIPIEVAFDCITILKKSSEKNL